MATAVASSSARARTSLRSRVLASNERPSESTTVHTRILRCMLALDDSHAYWQRVETNVPVGQRARVAFECRWFGTKSEARIRTFMTDMVERFDAYPEALALLHEVGSLAPHLRPFICHIHTQLADPIYRRFTGEFLPTRLDQGQATIDRDVVARWMDALEPGRWAANTRVKFASNLLATAADVGFVVGKKEPRKLVVPPVPDWVLGYTLYLLRDVQIEGSLESNPYLRSLGIEADAFRRLSARVPGVRIAELGGVIDITWREAGLREWGHKYTGGEL